MVNVSRRGFLKLLGLGAATTLVEPATNAASLFGAGGFDKTGPVLGHHIVVTAKPLSTQFPGEYSSLGRVGGGWDNPLLVTSDGTGAAFEQGAEICVPISKSDNPHIGYYVAAEKARGLFAQRSNRMLLQVPERLRSLQPTLITVCYQPIYARPAVPMPEWPKQEWNEEKGYEIVCDCVTRVVWQDDIGSSLEGWNVLSHYGEVPLETPDNISMAVLLDVDGKVLAKRGREWEEYKKTSLISLKRRKVLA